MDREHQKPKLNHRRLAAVALVFWFIGTSLLYLPQIDESYKDAARIAQRQRDELAKDKFFRCAAENGIDAFALARHYLNCKEEQNLQCNTWYPCDSEFMTDSCARQRVPKCSGAGLPEFGLDAKAYNADIRQKNVVFYLGSSYGHTLFEYIGLLFVPAILWVLSRTAGRHLWRWLTSGHRT